MPLTDEVARAVIQHQIDKFGVSVADYADTCRVSPEALKHFMAGSSSNSTLRVEDAQRVASFPADLVNAEQQELADAGFYGRPAPKDRLGPAARHGSRPRTRVVFTCDQPWR
jgi:hypothetical protein